MTTEPTPLPQPYTEEEQCVHEKLLQAGLLTRVKPRTGVSKRDRPRVTIEGKPLSETVIEERR
jgi:hypothetical protein